MLNTFEHLEVIWNNRLIYLEKLLILALHKAVWFCFPDNLLLNMTVISPEAARIFRTFESLQMLGLFVCFHFIL